MPCPLPWGLFVPCYSASAGIILNLYNDLQGEVRNDGVGPARSSKRLSTEPVPRSKKKPIHARVKPPLCGEWSEATKNDHHGLRMHSGDYHSIRQARDSPGWHFDLAALAGPLAEVSRAQGLLLGRMADVGMALRDINDVLMRAVLQKSDAGGRSTR